MKKELTAKDMLNFCNKKMKENEGTSIYWYYFGIESKIKLVINDMKDIDKKSKKA